MNHEVTVYERMEVEDNSIPLLKKMGIKQKMRTVLIDVPTEALEVLNVQENVVSNRLTGTFDYIHFFVKHRDALDAAFPKLKDHLNSNGMLWISWPKEGRLGTDLTLKNIIEIGYNHGLVESKTISINSIWSAIKFTFPREGKQYKNSYGNLRKGSL